MPRVGLPESKYTPPPAGTAVARLVKIVDMGDQETNWEGKKDIKHQVRLTWELYGKQYTTKEGKPMFQPRTYTFSAGSKATLRQHLESWLGKVFTKEDIKEKFDLIGMLGEPCLLGLVHEEGKNGTYAKVTSVGKIPDGMPVPDGVTKPTFLWLRDDIFDKEVFDNLHESIRDKIVESRQYKELTVAGGPGSSEESSDAGDDEIPF